MPIVFMDHGKGAPDRVLELDCSALDGQGCVLIRDARIILAGGRTTDSVLVADDRIVALGEAARATAEVGDVRSLSLPGLTVAPGFIDAHTHLVHMGFGLSRLDLRGTSSAGAALERVRSALAAHDPARPFIAEHWDDSFWPPGDRLIRDDLDRLAPRTPVVLRRVCCHKAVANGAALAHLSRHAAGAQHAARGLMDVTTGMLLEDAAMRLGELFPPSAEEVAIALDASLAHAAHLGVTGAHDIVTDAALRAQERLRRAGRLTLRITAHTPVEEIIADMQAPGAGGSRTEVESSPYLKLGGIKLFLDGSLGARTAALREPYADRPGETGLLLIDQSELVTLLRRIDELAITAVIHAIGDCAIARALDALESLGPEAVRAHRHRIEHFELVPDDLVERMAAAGATASMQPNFVGLWGAPGGMYDQALGRTRLGQMNRFRTLADHGVPLAFGSDCMSMGPLAGIEAAVHHPFAGERLTAVEALAAYTYGAAHAGFAENETGTIAPGKLADFVILDADPLAERHPTRCGVVATIVGGRCVYRNPSMPPGKASP